MPFDRLKSANDSVPQILEYWRAIYTRRTQVASIIILCVLLGFILTLLATPMYTATSRVEISRAEDKVTNVEGVEAKEFGQSLEFYQTQYSLLEARSLAERVARALRLTSDEEFQQAFGIDPVELAADGSRLDAASRQKLLELTTDALLDNLKVSPIRGSSLVDIIFISPSAKMSANISNAWADQFIQLSMDRRFASTLNAREYLERRLRELRIKLEESERDLVLYAARKQIISLDNSEGVSRASPRTLVSLDLESLNKELSEATAARISAESKLAASSQASEDALVNSAINGLREKRGQIQAEYSKAQAKFGPEYPDVVALKAQLDALDRSIRNEESRVGGSAQSKFLAAQKRERELTAAVFRLKAEFTAQQKDEIQYNILRREVDTNRQLYDGLLQRYKEIGVASVGNSNISIVDRAVTPEKPTSPKLLLNLAVAMLSGLLLSVAYVFALEQIDQSLKDPQDVKKVLNVPLLGVLPHLGDIDIIESLSDLKSVASEAFVSVRTAMSFLTDHGVPSVFAVTSTQPSEGKSTSAFALATTLARSGKRVVLVDGDMRNPTQHKLAQFAMHGGLSNFLSGDNNYRDFIVSTDMPNLSIMAAGRQPPSPADLLGNGRIALLFQSLLADYDHVVVDAPPVLGLADSPLIGGSVEGIVYIVEANGARIRAIETAMERLEAGRVHIFGAIVTKVDGRNSSYGYGYGYGYGYDYARAENTSTAETK